MKRIALYLLVLTLVLGLSASATFAKPYYIVNGQPSDTPATDASPNNYPGPNHDPILDEEFIDFDDLDAPSVFAEAEPLTDEYADLGIIFEGLGEVLNEYGGFGISGYSSPNFLAFNVGAGVPGPETMLFDPPVAYLDLLAGHGSSGTITMNAYNSNDVLVDTDVINGSSTLAWMSVVGDDIAYVVISFSGSVMCVDDLYFEAGDPAPVTLTLTPTTDVIPATGGDVVYDAHLVSTIGLSLAGLRYETYVTIPNGQVFGPLISIPWDLTPFMDHTVVGMTQYIPEDAPEGEYTFEGRAGIMANPDLQVTDSFPFTKEGGAGADWSGNIEDWVSSGSFITGEEAGAVALPSEFEMSSACPNPFNPTTSVAIVLPNASDLTVTVFNVMGQQVATLANGKYSVGQHNFVLDAANLSSGLYFIHATVPGEMNAIQKVTLMK